ncbi:protein EMBRYO DEFECTIVE 514 [Nicotiana sylvestris]|uniref:Protein DCL, chloroplastic-like isoform X1 n=1 Tax=Nicotiana sylvestris TaxID=4096 RepID=A0A1U7WJ51_NICSY|nr:PREDICTED: protein DCL, chloroplastic-like isoform X1 [Nicotiana sylvestris]
MAETEPQASETVAQTEKEEASAQKMDVEAQAADDAAESGGSKRHVEAQAADDAAENGSSKRLREEGDELEVNGENGDATKKPKVENSVQEEKKDGSDPVSVGSKSFGSSVEMFDYFYKLLHSWTLNLDLNKYEHMLLLDLLKKGHSEPEKKIGTGVRSFQIRFHPQFKSRCFFVVREDDSVDDFSFRKCVDQIQPLPANMQVKHYANGGKGGGGGGGRGGGYGRGRGRGGRSRY